MNSGVSWQVQGVRQEAREAAIEAAHRPDGFAGVNPAAIQGSIPAEGGQEDAANQIVNAIARLDRRLDQFITQGCSAISEIERRLNAVNQTVAELDRGGSSRPHAAATSPVDQALLEIAERQRALDGETPRNDLPRAPTQDLGGLERQLRAITDKVDTLRPCGIDQSIETLRRDLGEIGALLKDAMPRQVLEGLEVGVRQLAERIDAQSHVNVDTSSFAGIERGLAEVRDVMQALAPMERRAQFDATVSTLSKKVDDLETDTHSPIAFGQLEGAIVALRSIVSHVASNDALSTLSDEVRTLTAKVEQSSTTGILANIEQRIATLADALQVRNQSKDDSRSIEGSIQILFEKIDQLQLTRPEQVAVYQLESQIAQLVERIDASGPRLAKLEAIEGALAQLLGYLERLHNPQTAYTTAAEQAEVHAIKRDVQRTQDTLDSVHGTLNKLVDHLAAIEVGPYGGTLDFPDAANYHQVSGSRRREESVVAPRLAADPQLAAAAFSQILQTSESSGPTQRHAQSKANQTVAAATTPSNATFANQASKPERLPIDPSLPPDHPLEPGMRGRSASSPTERIVLSQSALGTAKPEAEFEPDGKVNFIAAARRAAQTAASIEATSVGASVSPVDAIRSGAQKSDGVRRRLRTILVATGVAIAVLGSLHLIWNLVNAPQNSTETPPPALVQPTPDSSNAGPIPSSLQDTSLQDNERPNAPMPPAEAIASNTGSRSNVLPESATITTSSVGILLPVRVWPPATVAKHSATPSEPETTSSVPAPKVQAPAVQTAATPARAPQQAPSLASSASRAAVPTAAASTPAARSGALDKLPSAIASPTLRAAAAKGDAAAEFEIASRLAEGRGVPRDLTAAAEWFERAAKQGLAPAQVRLGTLYEKGLGVRKSSEIARRHYLEAAEAGNARAMHNLAVLFAEGPDGKPDYQAAAKWFRRAADYGVADSQYNLAILYVRGFGTEANLGEAYKWFAIAAREGDDEAAKKRDDIGGRLDRAALVAARAASQAWSPQPQIESATNVQQPPGGWDNPAATPLTGKNRTGPKAEVTSPRAIQ